MSVWIKRIGLVVLAFCLVQGVAWLVSEGLSVLAMQW
jgi:hypothetical protein